MLAGGVLRIPQENIAQRTRRWRNDSQGNSIAKVNPTLRVWRTDRMTHQFWFKVTYTFTCPSCHKISTEKVAANSTTNDLEKLKASVNRQSLACQLCGTSLSDGVEISVDIPGDTLESLKLQGLSLPHTDN
jgi:hypothetical protein